MAYIIGVRDDFAEGGIRSQMTSSSRSEMSFIKEINKILGQNIREWGMYIALLLIMAFFTITTKGYFPFIEKHR